ncbi:hypothetical protein SG34_029650 [Thalassomonas viridans]|uniref:Uncharacterized protein n=1 Tax=Thalassomonas viridans TaxID=137584 RepID=A0AAE9Z8V5_9GAMM|nr:hypothetical protein [Thalassomonas viridans]WDE08906.1 hypothetical protein SG34_034015 [Thalassomonas viridans]WDE08953.1 hypothetical protein SG34_029650 [Thalassomonas viridans]
MSFFFQKNIFIVACSVIALLLFIKGLPDASGNAGYKLTEKWVPQMKYPQNLQSKQFYQQLLTLYPAKATSNSPLLFVLGNETGTTEEKLISLYRIYGSPDEVIFMAAEHRSYGGTLAITYSHKYPETLNVALASSTRVKWPLLLNEYAAEFKTVQAPGFVQRLEQSMMHIATDRVAL